MSHCVARIVQYWPVIVLLITIETFETKSLQAEKKLQSLKLTYIKASLELINYVPANIAGLNTIFPLEDLKLHQLL